MRLLPVIGVKDLYWAGANIVQMPDKQDKTGREEAWPDQVDAFARAKIYHGPSLLSDRSLNWWVAVLFVLLHVDGLLTGSFTSDARGVCSQDAGLLTRERVWRSGVIASALTLRSRLY